MEFSEFRLQKKIRKFFFAPIVFLFLRDESVPKPCSDLKSAEWLWRYRDGQDDRQKTHLHFSIRMFHCAGSGFGDTIPMFVSGFKDFNPTLGPIAKSLCVQTRHKTVTFAQKSERVVIFFKICIS